MVGNVKKFLDRVRERAAMKNLDIFAVASDRVTHEDANIYSSRGGSEAIRHARRAHVQWERGKGVKTAAFEAGVIEGLQCP